MSAAGTAGGRAPRKPPARRRVFPFELLLLALIALAVWQGPRAFEGYTALQWTRWHAAGGGDLKPAERARQTARWAARTIELLAPLPASGEAARLALQVARGLLPQHPAEAAALCASVLQSLERVRATRLRGLGLDAVGAELQALADEARARAAAAPPAETR